MRGTRTKGTHESARAADAIRRLVRACEAHVAWLTFNGGLDDRRLAKPVRSLVRQSKAAIRRAAQHLGEPRART